MKIGDPADFIIVEDLKEFKTLQTYIDGILVYENGNSKVKHVNFEILNNFKAQPKSIEDFQLRSEANKIRVIECLDGELITKELIADAKIHNGNLVSNTETDILKMVVVNRYEDQDPAIAFIKNFGLKEGAIASSVGHDSHNIIAVGVSDEAICEAVNLLIEHKGGICAVSPTEQKVVALPVAGIMSDKNAETIGKAYSELDDMAKRLGSTLHAPYMSLSFMALLVIPELKLSDKGLFNGETFQFTTVELS
jgi:adenine deaminase